MFVTNIDFINLKQRERDAKIRMKILKQLKLSVNNQKREKKKQMMLTKLMHESKISLGNELVLNILQIISVELSRSNFEDRLNKQIVEKDLQEVHNSLQDRKNRTHFLSNSAKVLYDQAISDNTRKYREHMQELSNDKKHILKQIKSGGSWLDRLHFK